MTKLLIDGDLLLYRAASASETELDWGDDLWLLHGNLAEARDLFTAALDGITDALGTNEIVMCLSDRENFRKDLTPTYKSKRKAVRKPVVFRPLLEWVIETYEPVIRPKLEADDVLGILATNPKHRNQVIVVSEDKDMQTLPGIRLFRQGALHEIGEHDGDYYWMFQTLTGDATDGYPGCPGIGPKRAEAILGTPGKHPASYLWPSVVNAYRKAGLTEEDALLNARLARILRYEDWDIETQQVKLWTPNASWGLASDTHDKSAMAANAA